MQANEANAIPGWEIKVEPVDDEGKAEVGKSSAAVSRTTRSPPSCGQLPQRVPADQPVFAAAAPSSDLWRHGPGAHDGRRPGSRARTSRSSAPAPRTSSRASSPQFLLDQGIKSVATIHDKKTYGQGLTYFTRPSRPAAAPSSPPRRSTRTSPTTARSSPRSLRPSPRRSTAVSTRRPGRSRSR